MLNKTFSALSDPTRQKILELLKKRDMAAGKIGEHFALTGATLSHHLGVLKEAGLIAGRRDGQEIIYSLNLSVFEEVAGLLVKFFKIK